MPSVSPRIRLTGAEIGLVSRRENACLSSTSSDCCAAFGPQRAELRVGEVGRLTEQQPRECPPRGSGGSEFSEYENRLVVPLNPSVML